MSDSDSDVPALVPSSDEEDVIEHIIKTNSKYRLSYLVI